MIGLPKSTEFDRRIPKQKFYDNMTISPALKRSFIDQIKVIYWRNKIAATTINLAEGEIVKEIEVLEIRLNGQELDEAVLRQIDKEIHYHIVFLLEYDGRFQAWTAYKEAAAFGSNAFKVGKYYHTDWMEETKLPIKIEGLSTDAVYENFVRQIAGDTLVQGEVGESLKESVNRDEEIQKLKKQISSLQAKIRKEKQLNVQVKLNTEIKSLKSKLEELQNG